MTIEGIMAGRYTAFFTDDESPESSRFRSKVNVIDRHVPSSEDGCYFRIEIPALELNVLVPRMSLSAPAYHVWDSIENSVMPFRIMRVPSGI